MSAVLIRLHTGYTTDLLTGRLLDSVWHRWMVTGDGIERICDGQGEVDGFGIAGNAYVSDGVLCDGCQEIVFADMLREKDARFDERFFADGLPTL